MGWVGTTEQNGGFQNAVQQTAPCVEPQHGRVMNTNPFDVFVVTLGGGGRQVVRVGGGVPV